MSGLNRWVDDGHGNWIIQRNGDPPDQDPPKPTEPAPSAQITAATNTTAGPGVAPPNTDPATRIDPVTGRPIGQAAPKPTTAAQQLAGQAPSMMYSGGGGAGAPPGGNLAAPPVAAPPRVPARTTYTPGAPPTALGTVDSGARRSATLAGPGAAAPAAPAPNQGGNVQVDYSRVDKAEAGYQQAINTFQNELDRLSGADPFGNQAFLKQATDRAVAQTAGTAAMARGGGAAMAGAQRQAVNTQAAQSAQGIQQANVQRAQDVVTASGQRIQAAGGLANTVAQQAGNEVQLAGMAETAGAANLDAELKKYGIDAQVTQQDKDSIRSLAVQMAQVDNQRYATDVNYRESINKNIIDKYASDNVKAAIQAQIKANGSLTGKDVIMGLLGAGTGIAGGIIAKSDRRAKFDVHDPDLRDLQDYLGKTKGQFYRYKNPAELGARGGVNFGPMAQDLAKSKIGKTLVKKGADGQYLVDTARMTLADHAALAALAADVEKLKRRGH